MWFSTYLCYSLKEPQYKPTCTVQAIGEDDRRAWMQVMEGREPVSIFENHLLIIIYM